MLGTTGDETGTTPLRKIGHSRSASSTSPGLQSLPATAAIAYPGAPWQSVPIHFVTVLPLSGDNSCGSICLALDRLMKTGHFLPLHTTTAQGFADLFVLHVW